MRFSEFTLQDIESLISSSLQIMHAKNNELIEKNLKEECINSAFCRILNSQYLEIGDDELSFDIEYDKEGENPKESPAAGIIRPDIVIHHRGSHASNFVFIEAKKRYLNSRDREKLLCALDFPFFYCYSIGISYLPGQSYFRFAILTKDARVFRWVKLTKVFESCPD